MRGGNGSKAGGVDSFAAAFCIACGRADSGHGIAGLHPLRFSSGLGWPAALMFAGLCLIGIGYLAFYLNRKYLSKAK